MFFIEPCFFIKIVKSETTVNAFNYQETELVEVSFHIVKPKLDFM